MEKAAINPLGEGYQLVNGQSKSHKIYHIERELGRGGFGITYLATADEYVDNIPQTTRYTIKEFCMSDVCLRKPDGSIAVAKHDQEEFSSSMGDFLHEAERLHKMKHEGIVPVKEVFEANGTAYYVMQYLGDQSLVKYVKENGGQLDEEEACRIAGMVAKALDYLHQQTVTHLDVKPENIMMYQHRNKKPTPILIDFGLACHYKKNGTSTSKHSATGTTDGYSPLEQYAGIKHFAPEADIYALGCTLYFMLTGKAPLVASEMSAKYLFKTLPDGLSDDTVETLRKSMEKIADRRTKSIARFLEGLPKPEKIIEGGNVTVKRDSSGSRTSNRNGKDNKMKYVLIAMGAIILLLLVVILMPSDKQKGQTSEERVEQVATDSTAVNENENSQTATTSETSQGNSTQSANNNQSTNTNQGTNTDQTGSSQNTQESQPAKPEPNYLDLGYAEWRGPVKNGKPNGDGIMQFKSSHRIDSRDPKARVAEAGDRIEGTYNKGHLDYGHWLKSDGSSETIMLGE